MATTDYETILREAPLLPQDEQQRLVDALRPPHGARVVDTETLRTLLAQGLGQPRDLPSAEQAAIDAWFAKTEELARGIGAAWKDSSISAVEAVHEQRRDLCGTVSRSSAAGGW